MNQRPNRLPRKTGSADSMENTAPGGAKHKHARGVRERHGWTRPKPLDLATWAPVQIDALATDLRKKADELQRYAAETRFVSADGAVRAYEPQRPIADNLRSICNRVLELSRSPALASALWEFRYRPDSTVLRYLTFASEVAWKLSWCRSRDSERKSDSGQHNLGSALALVAASDATSECDGLRQILRTFEGADNGSILEGLALASRCQALASTEHSEGFYAALQIEWGRSLVGGESKTDVDVKHRS